MRNKSKKMAFCGVLSGLSVSLMLVSYLFVIATFAAPAIAGVFLIPVMWEYKEKTAFTMYVAVSLLTIFFVPDKEMALMYTMLFGIYTVLKFRIEKLKSKPFKLLIKIGFVNLAIFLIYSILILIFPIQAVINEFMSYGYVMIMALIILFNITFLLYDKVLEKLLIIYVYKFRQKIYKS